MANFCCNNGYSFPAPSVSLPIFSQFNGTNMATTMHQHLVHFTPPSIRDNTALQVTSSRLFIALNLFMLFTNLRVLGMSEDSTG